MELGFVDGKGEENKLRSRTVEVGLVYEGLGLLGIRKCISKDSGLGLEI